jgi:integrase
VVLEHLRCSVHDGSLKECSNGYFCTILGKYYEHISNRYTNATVLKLRAFIRTLERFTQVNQGIECLTLDLVCSHGFHEDLIDYLISNEYKNSYITFHSKALKAFLRWSYTRGFHTNDSYKQFEKITIERTDRVTLNEEEIFKLKNKRLPKHLDQARDIFLFALFTGQRISDVLSIERKQVNEERWEFRSTKTKHPTIIPFVGFSRNALFILHKYNFSLPKLSYQRVNRYIKEACRAAKLNRECSTITYSGRKELVKTAPLWEFVTTHTARRTFITVMLNKGFPINLLMKLTGHKEIKTLMQYDHCKMNDVIRVMEQLAL